MLSNEDIAELIESTRERVQHMGGDTPTGAGVVRVLDGLIAMLREQVPAEDAEQEQDEEVEQQPVSRRVAARRAVARSSYESEAGEDDEPSSSSSSSSSEEVPGYLQHLRQTRGRRPVRETSAPPKPANPLSSPQYAGFFNALIASQKGEPAASEGEDQSEEQNVEEEEPPARRERTEPPVRSTVNPQYKGFFDAMVASQKPSRSESAEENAEEPPAEEERSEPPAEASSSSTPYRDETATS